MLAILHSIDDSFSLRTKEELAQQEREKLIKNHNKEIEKLTSERDTWQKLYQSSTIETAITNASIEHQAFSPSQINAYLGPKTRLVEGLDEKGKPNGRWVPEVTFEDVKDGKPIVLKLSPSEAVKRMKEMDEHVNLFKGEGESGLNRFQQRKGKDLDLKTLASDPKAYREARKAGTVAF